MYNTKPMTGTLKGTPSHPFQSTSNITSWNLEYPLKNLERSTLEQVLFTKQNCSYSGGKKGKTSVTYLSTLSCLNDGKLCNLAAAMTLLVAYLRVHPQRYISHMDPFREMVRNSNLITRKTNTGYIILHYYPHFCTLLTSEQLRNYFFPDSRSS